MARGWESKSVEAQQEDRAASKDRAPALTADQQLASERRHQRALALACAEAALAAATHPARRRALEAAIADLRSAL